MQYGSNAAQRCSTVLCLVRPGRYCGKRLEAPGERSLRWQAVRHGGAGCYPGAGRLSENLGRQPRPWALWPGCGPLEGMGDTWHRIGLGALSGQ